jgi:hypothetical protein
VLTSHCVGRLVVSFQQLSRINKLFFHSFVSRSSCHNIILLLADEALHLPKEWDNNH